LPLSTGPTGFSGEKELDGRPSRCPAGADALAYTSGFLGGQAERKRNIEGGGIGVLPDGTLNVVERGSATKNPQFERRPAIYVAAS
jgi:hypothetical protein